MSSQPPLSLPYASQSNWSARVGCIELSLNPGSPSGWSTRRDGLSTAFNPATYRHVPQRNPLPIPRFDLPISYLRTHNPSPGLLALARVSASQSRAEIPVHPDAQSYFGLTNPTSQLDSFITVSSRTVAVTAGAHAAFVKMDYPYRLGRCPRRILGATIDKSLASSALLKQLFTEAHQKNPARSRFALLPESIGYTVQTNEFDIGVIFREPDPWPAMGSGESGLVPFFAIPVPDKTGNCFLNWLLHSMVNNDPQLRSYLDAFGRLVQLISEYTSFMIESGVLHDSHAQNLCLEIEKNSGLPRRVVVRDLSHLYRLDEIKKSRLQKKVSHLVDSKIGTYVIKPMATRFEKICHVSRAKIRDSILEQFSFLAKHANLFPPDCWYARDSTENLDSDGNIILVRQLDESVLRSIS